MPELLRAEELTVARGGSLVLRGATLVVREPGIHVIVGPNGAGKSTLLAAIAGLSGAELRAGRILFMGRDVAGAPLHERARMGLVLGFQNPPGIRGLRLRDLVAAMEKIYGPRSRAAWAEELLNIAPLMEHPLAGGMSGGERKRAELYLVMLQEPRVALLDEPDSGVDVESLHRIMEVLLEARRRAIAVVLVSHTLTLLRQLAEKGAVDSLHVLLGGVLHRPRIPPSEALAVLEGCGFTCLAEAAG